jgi:hypothetical protein
MHATSLACYTGSTLVVVTMDKKQLHRLWTKIRPIRVWYLAVLVVVSAAGAIFALRANNLRMVELRQEVYVADEQNGDVEGALKNLRAYVYGHMNTKLSGGDNPVYPPIQLKYTYQRLQAAEQQRAQAANSQIYTDAQAHCEQQNSTDFSGRNRVPCIEAYVSSHGVGPRTVPDAMYKFDFVSPSWSPDLAGFGVAITIILMILLVLRIAAGWLYKRFVK